MRASADHLMVSLPYPYGPDLEWCETPSGKVQVLWLVPITGAEADLARTKELQDWSSCLRTAT